jgi:hypothetical protein
MRIDARLHYRLQVRGGEPSANGVLHHIFSVEWK